MTAEFCLGPDAARALDEADSLPRFRPRFHTQPGLVYLRGRNLDVKCVR